MEGIKMTIKGCYGEIFKPELVVDKLKVLPVGKFTVNFFVLAEIKGIEVVFISTNHGNYRDNTFHVVDQVKLALAAKVRSFELEKRQA